MTKNKYLIITIVGFLYILVAGYFQTPNYDDGFNAYFIKNTVDFKRPFFSDYFEMRFPIMKISTILLAIGYTYVFPFSYKLPAVCFTILLLISTYIVFKIARNYLDQKKSFMVSSFFCYFVFVYDPPSATRPEIWLITIILFTILLVEWYLTYGKSSYLIIGAIITGTLGLTFHSNASILYIYLFLFIFVYRKKLCKKLVISFFSVLFISSLLGLGIVFLPDPSEALRFFLRISTEGPRFDFHEFHRFYFTLHSSFYKYISFYFFVLFTVWFVEKGRSNIDLPRKIYNKYKNIILYTLAVVIGLVILPSARWRVYMFYYFLPIAFLFAFIFSSIRISKRGKLIVTSILILLILRLFVSRIMGPLEFDTEEIIKLLFFYFPLLLFHLFWERFKIILIYPLLFLWMSLRVFEIYSDFTVYDEVKSYYSIYNNYPIISHAVFNWIYRENDDFDLIPKVNKKLNQNLNKGIAIFGSSEESQAYPVKMILNESCSFDSIGAINKSYDNIFLSPHLKSLTIYQYQCSDITSLF
tara:strand:- start:488 stop:2068 length:1581 start_codon:yes stop_codon:yes gene_type:complete